MAVGVAVVLAEPVGVGLGVLLGVGDGLGAALLDGAGEGWPGAGEGAAAGEAGGAVEATGVPGAGVGELVAEAATANGPADGAAAAIMIPATIATTPPMAPAASSRTVQELAGFVPGPLPVNGCLADAGLYGDIPGSGRHRSKSIGRALGKPGRAMIGNRTSAWMSCRFLRQVARRSPAGPQRRAKRSSRPGRGGNALAGVAGPGVA